MAFLYVGAFLLVLVGIIVFGGIAVFLVRGVIERMDEGDLEGVVAFGLPLLIEISLLCFLIYAVFYQAEPVLR